jgi:tetratricopeptide (TPR) repeat protein
MQATIQDPNYYQSFCNMGSCYRAIGRFNEAIKSYKIALKINNKDCITLYNLANVFRIVGG